MQKFKIKLPHTRAYCYSNPAKFEHLLSGVSVERPELSSKQPKPFEKEKAARNIVRGKQMVYKVIQAQDDKPDRMINSNFINHEAYMPELPAKPHSFGPTTFTTTNRFDEASFNTTEECRKRSIIDWESHYPPENKAVDFNKYIERRDVTLTRSQIRLLAEIEDEKRVAAQRFRAMLEANEAKKKKEAALKIPDIRDPDSQLDPDGNRPIRFRPE